MPGGYSPGEYRVTLHFKLHPALRCDGSACPLSLNLARGGRHLPYLNVTIEARDALRVGAGVDLLYWGARVERAPGGGWVVEAPRLPGRADARLYLLIPASHAGPAAGVGRVDNATAAFLSMAGGAKPRVWLARWLPWALALSPAVPAVIAVAYYALHGREGRPRSPPPVGFPPRTGEKPWEVALLYTGEPGEPGDEVYAATAAYMASRGTLRLEPCDGEEGLAPGGEPSRGCE